jgi:hypothetical protein
MVLFVLYFRVYSESPVRALAPFRLRNSFKINGSQNVTPTNSPTINTSRNFSFFCISFILNDFNSTRISTSGAKDLKSFRINTSGNKDLKSFRINTSKIHRWGPRSVQFAPIFLTRARHVASATEFFANYHHRALSCYHSRAAQNRIAFLRRRKLSAKLLRSAKGDF